MEPVEFSFSFFHYSFWLLVGVPEAHREDPFDLITYLYQTGTNADGLRADAFVLR